jgi:endonuclease/exonuclease/phosphatase family metal-dependent hydrolase
VIVKLLSYNIRYGGRGREHHIASVIDRTRPDVVILQEATDPRVVERIATLCHMPAWGSRPGRSVGFLSRLEIAHYEWHRPPGTRHPFLELVVDGIDLRVFGLHLSAIHSRWTEQRRVRELRSLLGGIERHREGFHLLAGDFNALAPGELFDASRMPARLRTLVWLSGGDARRDAINLILRDGYADGFRLLHPFERGYTFPTWDPHVRLDYVFMPVAYARRLRTCEVVDGDAPIGQASDHFPLLAEIDAA